MSVGQKGFLTTHGSLRLNSVICTLVVLAWPKNDLSAAPLQALETEQAVNLYSNHCSGCHGEGGEGVVGPKLAGGKLTQKYSLRDQVILITEGTPRGMPAFGGLLSEDEILFLARFTRNF